MKNPIIYSFKVDKENDFYLPLYCRLVSIHFSVEKGDVQVFFGALTNTPSLKLYPGARWNQRVSPSEVNRVFVRKFTTSDFIVWITVEKLGGA